MQVFYFCTHRNAPVLGACPFKHVLCFKCVGLEVNICLNRGPSALPMGVPQGPAWLPSESPRLQHQTQCQIEAVGRTPGCTTASDIHNPHPEQHVALMVSTIKLVHNQLQLYTTVILHLCRAQFCPCAYFKVDGLKVLDSCHSAWCFM